MDVARALLGGLEDDRVDDPDKGRRRLILFGRSFLLEGKLVFLLFRGAAHRVDLPVEVAELQIDVLSRRDRKLESDRCGEPELVENLHVGRIADRDEQALSFEAVRQHTQPDEHRRVNRLYGRAMDADDAQVGIWKAVLLRELTSDRDARGPSTCAD
jgi:hypothetical protein